MSLIERLRKLSQTFTRKNIKWESFKFKMQEPSLLRPLSSDEVITLISYFQDHRNEYLNRFNLKGDKKTFGIYSYEINKHHYVFELGLKNERRKLSFSPEAIQNLVRAQEKSLLSSQSAQTKTIETQKLDSKERIKLLSSDYPMHETVRGLYLRQEFRKQLYDLEPSLLKKVLKSQPLHCLNRLKQSLGKVENKILNVKGVVDAVNEEIEEREKMMRKPLLLSDQKLFVINNYINKCIIGRTIHEPFFPTDNRTMKKLRKKLSAEDIYSALLSQNKKGEYVIEIHSLGLKSLKPFNVTIPKQIIQEWADDSRALKTRNNLRVVLKEDNRVEFSNVKTIQRS